jgi:hypothetical protein
MLIVGMVILCYGIAGWQHIDSIENSISNNYIGQNLVTPSEYLIVFCEIVGGIVLLITGPYLLYWYYELKKRYSRLMAVEKTLGA